MTHKKHIYTTTVLMVTKPDRMVTNLEGLPPIILLTLWSHGISTTAMPIATKLVRFATYHEGVPPIKAHDNIIV